MGLDSAAVKFLCAVKHCGADFSSTLTLGRQSFFPDAASLRDVFARLGVAQDAEEFRSRHAYSEDFFRLLGARTQAALDYSPFEGAEVVHDLNLPIPPELAGKYSLVFDGGTLEHVFNLPQALKSCLELVRVGGHFAQLTVANNYMGHGFWQLSPEAVFRVFTAANGFRLRTVLLHEVTAGGKWYAVSAPEAVASRVELCNAQPVYMLTLAQRVADRPIFAAFPQQIDYQADWDAASPHGSAGPSGQSFQREAANRRAGVLRRRRVPRLLRRFLRPTAAPPGPFDRPCYAQVSEVDLLLGRLPETAPAA